MSSSITTSGVSRDSGVDVNLRGDAPCGEPTENRDESWVTTNLTGSPETGSAVRPEPKAGAGVAPWHGAESDLVRPRNRDVASKAHMRPPSFVLQRRRDQPVNCRVGRSAGRLHPVLPKQA